MKNKLLFLISIIKFYLLAQQSPTNTSPGGIGPSGQNNVQFWSRAGNNGQGTNVNNIFGTLWNSGIYTKTNDQFRMKLNGTVNYTVNGFTGQRDGYLLLGATSSDNYSNANKGAASLLHMNGRYNTGIQPELGYRPWMQTGITMTDNDDLSYFGLRRIGYETDLTKSITETTICWSNDGSGNFGPDDMSFRFMGESSLPSGTINNNLLDNNDLDGRHVARFSNDGLFGIGNTFGINGIGSLAGLYVRPQALLHLSYSNLQSIWSQYTNRDLSTGGIGTGGTGETATDGLRIGILGNNNANANGTAAIYNQELKPILLSTNANSNTINPISGATGERVRITSVNTPTNLPAGGMGIYNPGSIPNNITRMSVSHNPSNPVTRPLSLLHLGYNTGQNSINASSTDGWRPWMDIGAFISDSSDNIYVGLKDEGNDRRDAVVNWGDNQNGGLTGSGPDNLRFIFTSTTTSVIPGDSVAASLNGLEVARMEPNLASTLPSSNFGMMGIGDFSPTGPNTANPVDAKLDIDGDLRVRTVTQQDSLLRVLVIDSADLNRVHYRNIPLNLGTGKGFVPCSDFTPAAYLSSDSKINLNNHNAYFEYNDSLGQNHVSVGYKCSSILPGKFSSLQTHPTSINANSTAIHASNIDISNANALTFQGVYGESIGPNTGENYLTKTTQIGGDFFAKNGIQSFGIRGISGSYPNSSVGSTNVGGYFHSQSNLPFNTLGIGVVGISTNAGTNYGVYGAAPDISPSTLGPNFAGYFNGDVLYTGQVGTSDQMFKTNIDSIPNALNIVNNLKPRKYEYNVSAFQGKMNFKQGQQYGFIAQEVQTVLPELVGTAINPAIIDSSGNEVSQAFQFKTLNYMAIIPILTKAIQEQNAIISHQDSMINELNNRLSNLENCINSLNLCNQNQPTQMAQPTTGQTITLNTVQSIVLNQNVPNPFAEQTVISYSIPESVQKANILFYDSNGKMINNVDIKERGNSQLNVFANDLSTGIYTYTLVADGQIVATKKMVKQ
jgi:hypothetical protein